MIYMRRAFIFSVAFSVVGIAWIYSDNAFFGANGWIIDGMFSFLVVLKFWDKKQNVKQNGEPVEFFVSRG